ncbi:MAG: prepilin-type N-terminal cleavage/methylation domain-containing protein, partial [Actinomycetota bacterium]
STERRRDGGMTLPEVLVTTIIAGVIVASISLAFSVMLRTTPQAETRLAESKDVTFLQAWIPLDLSTATGSWDTPVEADLRSSMAAVGVSVDADLDGTNVLTVVVPNADTGANDVISYRYAERNGEWRIVRYQVIAPGTGAESVRIVGVANEVPPPPAGWSPGDPVDHAISIDSRNATGVLPVGEDVTVRFESGNEFQTGGAGLSAQQNLDLDDVRVLPDPTAPPTRCGGRIAMVIDTSGSVPIGNGGSATEDAAIGFIDAFVGTPTLISINGFDREGYAMIDDPARGSGVARYTVNGGRADFLSVLDPTDPDVSLMRDRIDRLDDLDGAWPGNGNEDVNGDGVFWNQIGPATNWEDGLYNIFFDSATGQPHNTFQPDLVVFITDGRPWVGRTAAGGWENIGETAAVQRAVTVADAGRSQGSRVIGIIVGTEAANATAVANLEAVVGSNEWDGAIRPDGSIDVGNAVAADFFRGSFSELGAVLRSITIAECGGTLTLRKQLDDGTTPPGTWTYTSPTGEIGLDTDVQSSVTLDFNFDSGVFQQTVRITEEPRSGFSFVRGDCTVAGQPIDSDRVVQRPDGVPGIDVTVRADEAVSCVMISEVAS